MRNDHLPKLSTVTSFRLSLLFRFAHYTCSFKNTDSLGNLLDSYQTRQHATVIDGIEYQIKSLKDRNQFYDPDGAAEKLGISSAMWPISGLLWPSGIVLARIIGQLPLNGLKVLEVGCGVALASLVALSKGADITACDYHPMTQQLLNDNTALNKLGQIKYFHGNWLTPITGQGPFDLIVGSDLLYATTWNTWRPLSIAIWPATAK